MGGICSKSGTHTGGHTVLNSSASDSQAAPLQGSQSRPDARAAAAEAAERRLQSERKRGTNAANPNRGKLAAKLEASKSPAKAPEPRQEEQLVWD